MRNNIKLLIVLLLFAAIFTEAQQKQGTTKTSVQIIGTPGSPAATTTISGHILPVPDGKFVGVIKQKASESTPAWSTRIVPPKGAPNVLLIMLDDAGFGATGTFGGVVPTLAKDRFAMSGLRYTNLLYTQ